MTKTSKYDLKQKKINYDHVPIKAVLANKANDDNPTFIFGSTYIKRFILKPNF